MLHFAANGLGKAAADDSNAWGGANHLEDLEEVLGSRLQPVQSLAVVAIWGVK